MKEGNGLSLAQGLIAYAAAASLPPMTHHTQWGEPEVRRSTISKEERRKRTKAKKKAKHSRKRS